MKPKTLSLFASRIPHWRSRTEIRPSHRSRTAHGHHHTDAAARRYRDELAACFEQLAHHPGLRRRSEQLGAGLRRYEHPPDIVFYQAVGTDILIVRILHYQMEARLHF